jgi:hypothetical protein
MNNDTDFHRAIAALACVLAAFGLVAAFLPDPGFHRVFDEDGLVEWISLLAWFVAAVVFLRAALAGAGATAWLSGLVCLAASLREGDVHKSLTGYSVLKLRFFTGDAFPIWEKLVAALIVVPIAVALAVLAVVFVRTVLHGGLRRNSVRLVLLTTVLLFISKLLDRAPAVLLDWYAIDFSTSARRWMLAYEEGIEALLPISFLLAFLVARKERRQPRSDQALPSSAHRS